MCAMFFKIVYVILLVFINLVCVNEDLLKVFEQEQRRDGAIQTLSPNLEVSFQLGKLQTLNTHPPFYKTSFLGSFHIDWLREESRFFIALKNRTLSNCPKVYLVKAHDSNDLHDSWLCGGALVTTTQILTSAACIIDLENIYAIAGYKKYVSGSDLDKDNCTRINKQKVVKIRVPQEHLAHAHEYSNTTQWMSLDIGVATVEKPYDFDDMSYRMYCSYTPAAIEINYNVDLDSKVGTSVVALGWGRDRGSKSRDLVDRNSETLREVSTTVSDKRDCMEQFKGNGLSNMIDKYMICTSGRGVLDAEGYIIENTDERAFNRCINMRRQVQMSDDFNFDEECKGFDIINFAKARKFISENVTFNETRRTTHNNSKEKLQSTRRQGICQNDHGGPLITWVGSTELLIGVAINSLYDADYNCIGPYLFISTSAVGDIIKCLLTDENSTRKNCPSETLDGYEVFEHSVDLDSKPLLRSFKDEPPLTTTESHPLLRTIFNDTDINVDDDLEVTIL